MLNSEIDKCKNGFYCIEPCPELQQLKAENEELRKRFEKEPFLLGSINNERIKYKQCLDEIEEVAKNGVKDDCGMPLDELSIILNIIKQAKEDE